MTSESMTAMDAIYRRRAVRDYLTQKVDQKTINELLDAAVHAPTAMHEEPWSFVVIQDKATLDRLSQSAKEQMRAERQGSKSDQSVHVLELVNDSDFHLFYNASTLIVICSKSPEATGVADCWLAAQNLMLAACAKGLGTCIIGLATSALNLPEWKTKLKIQKGTTVIAAIIVGFPSRETKATSRKPPEVILWK